MTITVPEELAGQVEALVAGEHSRSVSSFYAGAAAERLAREESLRRLREFTGGPPPADLRARAEQAFAEPRTGRRPKTS